MRPVGLLVIVWLIVGGVAAIGLIAAIARVARNKGNQHRHVEADKIREAAKDETLQVKQREVLADETAAEARAAQAEADVKAAQASGVQSQAAVHPARQRPPATSSTSSRTARTRWIRPHRHLKHRRPPTARNTKTIDGLR
jgi:hypothetical protein